MKKNLHQSKKKRKFKIGSHLKSQASPNFGKEKELDLAPGEVFRADEEDEFEKSSQEMSRLIDDASDDRHYLANTDVVSNLRKTENKYKMDEGEGTEHPSKSEYDEVERLERMIEKDVLANKKKQKAVAAKREREEAKAAREAERLEELRRQEEEREREEKERESVTEETRGEDKNSNEQRRNY